MKLYNTLTQKKETLKPLTPGKIGMYVCGPTVYDLIHLGNARAVVVFDILFRVLALDYDVTYVRNITDVDDKINAAAQKQNRSIHEITTETTQAFHEDIAALHTLPPTEEPRATAHIDGIIEMIQALVEIGQAYVADGHVLFDVTTKADYGCLSKRKREDLIAGARVEVAPYKKDPGDFVLWKPSDGDTPGWDSPWGFGRPGWHIECSVMSQKYLGPDFDIHGGGQDLIFPHHENERAQSTALPACENFAHTWVHNGMITVNGEKMSKSLGNFITARQALKEVPGEAIRYVMLMTHYRASLDWTAGGVTQGKKSLDRLYTALKAAGGELRSGTVDPQIKAALMDDLNTSLALSHMHDLATRLNKDPSDLVLAETLLASGQVLGLFQEDPVIWLKGRSDKESALSDAEIDSMIQARETARKERDFAEADRLRAALAEHGILLEDTPQGTEWRRGS